MIPHVGQDRAELGPRGDFLPGGAQPSGDTRGADHGPIVVDEGNLVGDVPDGQPVRLANHFDAVDDPFAGQHIFVINPELVGQEGRGQIIVGLSHDVLRVWAWLAGVATIHRIVEQKRPVDPAIAAVAIFDPDQDIFDAVEKLGQLQPLLVLSHHGNPVCPFASNVHAPGSRSLLGDIWEHGVFLFQSL